MRLASMFVICIPAELAQSSGYDPTVHAEVVILNY